MSSSPFCLLLFTTTTTQTVLLSACKYPIFSLNATGLHQRSVAGLSLFAITEHTLLCNCHRLSRTSALNYTNANRVGGDYKDGATWLQRDHWSLQNSMQFSLMTSCYIGRPLTEARQHFVY